MSRKRDASGYDEATSRTIKNMIDAENRALTDGQEAPACDCKDGIYPATSRRSFLTSIAAATGASTAALLSNRAAATPGAVNYKVQPDPTHEPGRLTGSDQGYGSRSQFETETR